MREIEGGEGGRKQATQRSNVGRARGDQFWQAARHFCTQNFIEKLKKQLLSPKINERKLKRTS